MISTLLPSVKAYLPGRQALMIRDNNQKKLLEAILYLFHNPERRRKMGSEANKRAKNLNWSNIATQYEVIYLELADKY
jgi:glycosyltransferase involved in cell wall biosynthesis